MGSHPAKLDEIEVFSLPEAPSDSLYLNATHKQQLQTWTGVPFANFSLCYRMSTNGTMGAHFHKGCGGRGKTITIIKSQSYGNLFGFFVTKSWKANNFGLVSDLNSFAFALKHQRGKMFTLFPKTSTTEHLVHTLENIGT